MVLAKGRTSVQGFSVQALSRALFKAELPEHEIRALPAQSLYLALKHNGISSSAPIVELASDQQCQLMLDMDLFSRDRFNEEQLWEWLALSSEEAELEVLQKLLRCFDYKLIAILIARHVEFSYFEEPTDQPPGPQHYTPDKGRTWLHIKITEAEKHFLLGRLLALIFETDSDLFYKLLSIAQADTLSSLEEGAFIDRTRRLSAEGIPAADYAFELTAPFPEKLAAAALQVDAQHPVEHGIFGVEPLIYQPGMLKPFQELFEQAEDREALESELTLITNAALIRYAVELGELPAVILCVRQVRGAINVGLERATELSKLNVGEIHARLGIKQLFGLGIGLINDLRRLAQQKSQSTAEPSPEEQLAIEAASLVFPMVPEFMLSSAPPAVDGKLPSDRKPIETLEELARLRQILK
ncbi:MAG: hypothetical protein K1X83_01220 [Oligoflexia bacterium]|nr:hypothetical protein [Oligoflexia bacterium]